MSLIVTERLVATTPSARVMLTGDSMWTRIIVGETTLREGMPDDIDWNKASGRNKIPDHPTTH